MVVCYKCYISIEFIVSEGIDVIKTFAWKECDICHHWYFLNYNFKFQLSVCNRFHDLLMVSMNLRDIAILTIKNSDYRCIISLISKNEDIKLHAVYWFGCKKL